MKTIWSQDTAGWYDLDVDNGKFREPIASFQLVGLNGDFAVPNDPDAQWVVLWHSTGDDEYLNPNEYTEDDVRKFIDLKYTLLKGEPR